MSGSHSPFHSHHHAKKNMKDMNSKLIKMMESPDIEKESERPTNGKDAWARLKQGNERFSKGEILSFMVHLSHEINPEMRQSLLKMQKPFATIVACSDSRIAPELIFNEGLGEVFVVRVAGNVLDEISLGSIEYGCGHLGTPLLVLLGHQFCGAVTAALTGAKVEGNIDSIMKKLQPAVQNAKKSKPNTTDQAVLLDCAVQENVKLMKAYMMEKSETIKKLVDGGKVNVISAEYYLETGLVKEI